jgi:hypothetical protein
MRGRVSPSIYAIFAPPSVYDGCGQPLTNNQGSSKTRSYATDELSTLQKLPNATTTPQVFNFGDLPCPPPGIQYLLEPGSAYAPILHPPFDLKEDFVNSSYSDCDMAPIKDPPGLAVVGNTLTPPGHGGP